MIFESIRRFVRRIIGSDSNSHQLGSSFLDFRIVIMREGVGLAVYLENVHPVLCNHRQLI